MELMKRLRSAKNASGTKEEKKKTTSGLDADIHKLLGTEYKRYRAVSASVKAEHAAKKVSKTGAPTQTAPPPVASAVPTTTVSKGVATKKKKAGGTSKKSKGVTSTTVG